MWYKNIKECIQTGKSSANLEKYQMVYVTEEKFNDMVENYKDSGNTEVYKYFTLNDENEILIAHGRKTTETITTDDPEKTLESLNEGNSGSNYQQIGDNIYSSAQYTMSIAKRNYLTYVEQYSMPFNLLLSFLIQTKSYELTKEIADLAYESKIAIAIYDNETVSSNNSTETYNKHLRYTENTELIFPSVGQTTPSINISDNRYRNITNPIYSDKQYGEDNHILL